MYRRVEFNLVVHTLKSFSFHITIVKIVYLEFMNSQVYIGEKKKISECSYLNVDFSNTYQYNFTWLNILDTL